MTRIKGFDGLRGLAASAVVLSHTILGETSIGRYAMCLFFVLSGFLIVGILHRARLGIESGRSAFEAELYGFWIRRALRIMPLYYVVLLVYFPLKLFSDANAGVEFTSYLLYLQNFYIGFVTLGWNSFAHTWSLAIEQQFYVLAAPILLLAPSRYHGRGLLACGIACLLASAAMALAGADPVTIYTFPTSSFVLLCVGGGVYLEVTRTAAAAPDGRLVAAACALAVAIALTPSALIAETSINVLARIALSAPAFGLLLAYVRLRQDGAVVAGLEHPFLVYLGQISYSLYLVHLPVAATFQMVFLRYRLLEDDPASRDMLWLALVIVTSVSLAALLYATVERNYFRWRTAATELNPRTL